MFNFIFPKTAYAFDINTLLSRINTYIINPIIILMFAVATLVFVYGIVEFLASPDSEEVKTKGRQHMLWGIVGMLIMISVFGIMNLLISSFGLTLPGGGPIIIPKQ